ncbi:MAG: 16S rRNA (guanine(966)-N(2))-methyltransferase RsmD [candidate division WOR-3 bacterium]|nr:MAG: 16S rRNA (guanine(966)-N(2))-methyltransferase RsmD [candidate division WOR-3 bacterium]
MQIRSGRLKGRELFYPRSGLRPTKDITRQAIFNIIGPHIRNARILDLFAGGGALGIEALSRGAKEAVFVDNNPGVLKLLRANVKGLADIPGIENTRVMKRDAAQAIRRLKRQMFDIVFADPPYRQDHVQATLDQCLRLDVVKPGGILIIEHHRLETPDRLEGWELLKHGKYGDSEVTVVRRLDE